MSKSIFQLLLEHWQAWGHNHSPGEFVPVYDHPLSKESASNSSEQPTANLGHSIMWPDTRQKKSHLCAHHKKIVNNKVIPPSPPNWTNPASSPTLTIPSTPFTIAAPWGHHIIFLYSTYIVEPRTVQSTPAVATAVPWFSRTIPSFDPFSVLCLKHPKIQLAFWLPGNTHSS